MKPDKIYTGRSTIRMFNMDCMDFLNECEENQYELAIVDPPYGLNMDNQKVRVKPNRPNTYKRAGENQYKESIWDAKPPKKAYFNRLFRVCNNQIIWGANYFCSKLNDGNGWIFWDKQMGENNFSAGEFAFQSIYKKSSMYSKPSMRVEGTRIHPTEKPIDLYRWLLQNYATEGDTILDTHGGSMSIAIACWEEGFDLDICELDEDYFNDAVKRFENHISQTQLF